MTIRSIRSIGALVVGSAFAVGIGSAQAAPASVTYNGNTYYAVNGNDQKMDTGNEVCAGMGKAFLGYKSISTNAICKLFHPNARTVESVNGSKAGFYCNGKPQTGLACGNMKNSCQVCKNCNLNEAATGDQPIGQHFAEMYVWCGAASSSSSVKSAVRSSRPARPSVQTHAGTYGPLPLPTVTFASSAKAKTGSVTCAFSQKPLKKVTCGAVKAADTFCVLSMQSTSAKALSCQDTGRVVCSLPCSAPGAGNLKQCAYGGVMSGSCAK